eukprot:29486-Eustigmatos_ZCMA.PRE.1
MASRWFSLRLRERRLGSCAKRATWDHRVRPVPERSSRSSKPKPSTGFPCVTSSMSSSWLQATASSFSEGR